MKKVRELTDGKGADIVCQAASYTDTNIEEYMNLATELVKDNGIIAFQGDFLHPITLQQYSSVACRLSGRPFHRFPSLHLASYGHLDLRLLEAGPDWTD